jgi:hypothetical protein
MKHRHCAGAALLERSMMSILQRVYCLTQMVQTADNIVMLTELLDGLADILQV